MVCNVMACNGMLYHSATQLLESRNENTLLNQKPFAKHKEKTLFPLMYVLYIKFIFMLNFLKIEDRSCPFCLIDYF